MQQWETLTKSEVMGLYQVMNERLDKEHVSNLLNEVHASLHGDGDIQRSIGMISNALNVPSTDSIRLILPKPPIHTNTVTKGPVISTCSPQCNVSSPYRPKNKKTRKKTKSKNKKRQAPQKWTSPERKYLIRLVQAQTTDIPWKSISKYLPGRSSASCAQQWFRVCDPSISKLPWSAKEEELLVHTAATYQKKHQGNAWAEIAKHIQGRTDIQCRYRYSKIQKSLKLPWTPLEETVYSSMNIPPEKNDGVSWDVWIRLFHRNRGKGGCQRTPYVVTLKHHTYACVSMGAVANAKE